ncbi:MAG: hypothetical protein IPH45_11655 [Bacteroidales bacterium]|nr:hypothetical protein [Bacteroidales bacterium]
MVGSVENDQSICYNAVPAELIGTPPTGGNTLTPINGNIPLIMVSTGTMFHPMEPV